MRPLASTLGLAVLTYFVVRIVKQSVESTQVHFNTDNGQFVRWQPSTAQGPSLHSMHHTFLTARQSPCDQRRFRYKGQVHRGHWPTVGMGHHHMGHLHKGQVRVGQVRRDDP